MRKVIHLDDDSTSGGGGGGTTPITGTPNNTARFDGSGDLVDSDLLTNDGSELTANGLLKAKHGLEIDSSVTSLFVKDSNGTFYQVVNPYGDNGTELTTKGHQDYTGGYFSITDKRFFLGYKANLKNGVTISAEVDRFRMSFGVVDGLNGGFLMFECMNNSVAQVTGAQSLDTFPIAIGSANYTAGAGVINSVAIAYNGANITENDTAYINRGIINAHAKYLTDPTLDSDWNDLSIPTKKYIDNVALSGVTFATQAEVNAGVSTDTAISPQTVRFNYLSLLGGTMGGQINQPTAPVLAHNLTNKEYVDTLNPVKNLNFTDSPYTAAWGEHLNIDDTAGTVIVNVPTSVGNNGKTLILTKTSVSTNTIDFVPNGVEVVLTNLPLSVINQYDTLTIKANGTSLNLL